MRSITGIRRYPMRQAGALFVRRIESALSQTYSRIEVVVIDDGSPDNTAEVMARYSGIVRVRQDNRGLAEARNAGSGASTGNHMVFFLTIGAQSTTNHSGREIKFVRELAR